MVLNSALLLVIGVTGGMVISLVIIPYLKNKKHINVADYADTAKDMIDSASPVVDELSTLAPTNPAVMKLKAIKDWGQIAAGYAQQICHTGDIAKEDRATVAENIVMSVLKDYLKLDVSENESLLIDTVIKATVDSFGHEDSK